MEKKVIKKICTGCLEEKLLDGFYLVAKGKYGRDLQCKGCRLKQKSDKFANDPEFRKAEMKRSKKNKLICRDRNYNIGHQLKKLGCFNCPEFDLDVLEFVHVDRKKYFISWLMVNGKSVELLISEVERCDIACPTCHLKFDLGKITLPNGLKNAVQNRKHIRNNKNMV